MFRKCFSFTVAVIVSITTTVTAFAAPNGPREEFFQALKKTSDQWQYENDLFQEVLPFNQIMNELSGKAKEKKIYVSADIDTYAIYIENTSQADPSKNQIKTDTAVNIANGNETVDFQIALYLSPDEIAFSIPSIYDKTLVINKEESKTYFEDLDFDNVFGYLEDLDVLSMYMDLGSLNWDVQFDESLVEAINQDYGQFFMEELAKGTFSYGQRHSLTLSDGTFMPVQDITLTLSPAAAEDMFMALSEKIENDEKLYQFFYQIYEASGYNKMMSTLVGQDFDMAEILVEALVDICWGISFDTNVNYTIGVNDKGYAVKHTLVTTDSISYSPTTISLEYETKGANYLTDDIRFAILIDDIYGFEMVSYGHSVPRNGNVNNTTLFNILIAGKTLNIFGCETYYYANRPQDNLSIDCYAVFDLNSLYAPPETLSREQFEQEKSEFETYLADLGFSAEEAEEYMTEMGSYSYEDYLKEMETIYSYYPEYDVFKVAFSAIATINYSEANSTLDIDFHTCTFEYEGNVYSFAFGFFLKPFNGSIKPYDSETQSIFTLSETQLNAILEAAENKVDALSGLLP